MISNFDLLQVANEGKSTHMAYTYIKKGYRKPLEGRGNSLSDFLAAPVVGLAQFALRTSPEWKI